MVDILKVFIEISLTGTIMIGLVWGFRAVFSKKISPTVTVALWFAVLLRLCVPFTIESPIHAADIIEVPEAVSLAQRETATMPVNISAPAIIFEGMAGESGVDTYAEVSNGETK